MAAAEKLSQAQQHVSPASSPAEPAEPAAATITTTNRLAVWRRALLQFVVPAASTSTSTTVVVSETSSYLAGCPRRRLFPPPLQFWLLALLAAPDGRGLSICMRRPGWWVGCARVDASSCF